MKRLLVLAMAAFGGGSVLAEPEAPEVAFLPIQQIFSIERGFDTNDMVEIAVWGYLPDTCHKLGQGSYQVDHANKKIYVNVSGYIRQSEMCLQVITPFHEVIQVGILKAGEYEVQALFNDQAKGKLEVKQATTEDRDDYLYAPVDNVELVMNASLAAPHQSINIKGTYPFMVKGCMRIVDIKSYTTHNNILVVQPVAGIFDDKDCDPSDVDGFNRFNLSKRVRHPILERGLVHVRTLSGRAVNKFVDFRTQN